MKLKFCGISYPCSGQNKSGVCFAALRIYGIPCVWPKYVRSRSDWIEWKTENLSRECLLLYVDDFFLLAHDVLLVVQIAILVNSFPSVELRYTLYSSSVWQKFRFSIHVKHIWEHIFNLPFYTWTLASV